MWLDSNAARICLRSRMIVTKIRVPPTIARLTQHLQTASLTNRRFVRKGALQQHGFSLLRFHQQCRADMTEAPVGEWESPITSELITSSSIRLGNARPGKDGYIYWLEARPSEGGRSVLVRQKIGGNFEQLTPGPESKLNARTRVHEYGGGESIIGDGVLYFSNFADQRLYKQVLAPKVEEPKPLTAAGNSLRFADGIIDEPRKRIITVQEDHSGSGEAVNTIAAVDTETGESTVLVKGNDFYSSPSLSKDGRKLAWIEWSHPNMPWDDTQLWTAELDESGSVKSSRKVAGDKNESVMQPEWTKEGQLVFISDRSGWWNLYLETAEDSVRALYPRKAEFGDPAWMFNMRHYSILSDGRILAKYSDPQAAGLTVVLIDPSNGESTELKLPRPSLSNLVVKETAGKVILATVAASPKKPSAVIALEVSSLDKMLKADPSKWVVMKEASTMEIDEGYLSEPVTIEYPTENGLTAFMNYYPPNNKDYRLPQSVLPPLLVKIHGGPTSQASTAFSTLYQYWCSRGFAIADVNYGGSTGYGRAYRERLRDNWGIVDVDDVANAANHLAKEGKVDGKRLCIDGGSAGGYTTLAALAFRDVFSAGASLFGVADCELLAQETHKFESRYLDGLIGPYPEKKKVYEERSPIHSVDKFKAPVILFQGTEDKVVPMSQATTIYEKLKAKGLTTALVLFEGEQHGFRGTPAIRASLDGEFYFYGKALGFNVSMPEGVPAPEIVNLRT